MLHLNPNVKGRYKAMLYDVKSFGLQVKYKALGFKVETQGDVVFVRRMVDGEIICDARVLENGRLRDIQF